MMISVTEKMFKNYISQEYSVSSWELPMIIDINEVKLLH